MSGILRLESLTKGNTLKQGDKTPLKYRLFDADGEKLSIAGKSAKVRLVYPDFLTIGYEKDGLTVAQDDTVTFTIDKLIPAKLYHVEIIVDDKYIFPSRADESKFTVDKSSLGTESSIIEIVGVDAVVRKAVDLINQDPSLIIDEDKLVTDIISNTGIGNINEYYKAFNDLKPKAEQSITKSSEALTKSQNALNVANGIDAKATNALSLSESADTLSKSVQEQFNQIVIDGDSSVEAAQARVDASGQTNATLKARLDKEHNEVTTQLAQTTKQFNVVAFGADPNGINDSTQAFNDAIEAVRNTGIGGSVYIPSGNYKITSTLNFSMPVQKTIRFFGDGDRSSVINWHGVAGAVFSNTQTGTDKFQKSKVFKDLMINNAVNSSVSSPTVGSIGIYIEMNSSWILENMRIIGFDKGLFVGVHADSGRIDRSAFAYCNKGVELYGDQSDGCVIDSTWFESCLVRGLEMSSPRSVVTNCMFVSDKNFAQVNNYVDIQIGYKKIRTEDKTKSTYMGSSIGNGAIFSTIQNSFFEASGFTQPSILIQDFDSGAPTFRGLTIENNYFGLYDRATAIKLTQNKSNFLTRNNKIESNAYDYHLIDYASATGSRVEHNEPHINNVFKNATQKWQYGAKGEEFNNLNILANSVLTNGGWGVYNPYYSSGVNITTDYNGVGGLKSVLNNVLGSRSIARFTVTNCPEGMIYVSTKVQADIKATLNVSANRGAGSIFTLRDILISNEIKEVVFGFYNNAVSTINIDFYLNSAHTGTVLFDEVLIKHEDGTRKSNLLIDTTNGTRITYKAGQVFDIPTKTPFVDIVSNADPTKAFYYGLPTFATVSGAVTSGATSITVSDATNINVGDYVFFQQFSTRNIHTGFKGTVTTGNKVTAKSGNTLTLATGVPFDLLNGSAVLACKVYQKSQSTTL